MTIAAALETAPARARRTALRANWILGPREDLIWLIGSVLAAWAIFAMHSVLHWNMILVWFVWVVLLDTPHFWATYSRTYLDREEWRQRRPLLIGSLGIFLLGPVAMIVSYGLLGVGAERFLLPWVSFKILVSLWAYWHITRQHYGFMRLYQRKNEDTGRFDLKLDAWVLYGCLLLPFVALLVRHQDARARLGLGAVAEWPAWNGAESLVPTFASLSWEHWIVVVTAAGVAVLLTALVARQIVKARRGEPLNLPKLLFFAAVIPLHLGMCYSPALLATGLLTFTVIVTIYHDIQYLAIVWFHGRNRYEAGGVRQRSFGLAEVVTRNPVLWLGAGILVASVPVWTLGCLINRVPVCETGPALGQMTFLGDTTWIAFFVMLTSGIQMHHYLLDQFIWKPSRDARLREDLKLEPKTV